MLASGKDGHCCQGTELIPVNPVEGLGRRSCCPTASPRLQVPRSRRACEGTAGGAEQTQTQAPRERGRETAELRRSGRRAGHSEPPAAATPEGESG